jgi:hypothetical protein
MELCGWKHFHELVKVHFGDLFKQKCVKQEMNYKLASFNNVCVTKR